MKILSNRKRKPIASGTPHSTGWSAIDGQRQVTLGIYSTRPDGSQDLVTVYLTQADIASVAKAAKSAGFRDQLLDNS